VLPRIFLLQPSNAREPFDDRPIERQQKTALAILSRVLVYTASASALIEIVTNGRISTQFSARAISRPRAIALVVSVKTALQLARRRNRRVG